MTITQTIEAVSVVSSTPMPQFRLKPQGQWTYQDWFNFPEDGWKYEIINGDLYIMPPPAIYHQQSSIGLAARMYLYVLKHKLGRILEAPCSVKLPKQDVPVEPDIFFIKQERLDIIGKTQVKGSPDLVIEILSPSNFTYDRETKFAVYQENGVPEYWLVNYWQKTIEVFVLREGSYQLQGKYGLTDTVLSEQLTGFTVDVAEIFDF